MIYLIDFENVHEEGFSSLGRLGEKDAVYCFFTRNVAKISMSALACMRSGQLHFVEAESGKQSLDLALVSFLGYLIGTRPQEQYFEIVSNDNGFQKVAEFWNNRGNNLRVRVRKTNEQRQKAENSKSVSAQPSRSAAKTPSLNEQGSAGNSSETDNNSAGSVAGMSTGMETAVNPDPVLPSPAGADEKTVDASILPALTAAGLSSSAAEFLLAQVEKYRSDKNVKQLVYRAVVKKYGQKAGTQIYNSAKKIMLK